jgi:hypothetical protein
LGVSDDGTCPKEGNEVITGIAKSENRTICEAEVNAILEEEVKIFVEQLGVRVHHNHKSLKSFEPAL